MTNADLNIIIGRAEWERRYAARIMERADWPEHAAIEAARVGAEEYERGEREYGNIVLWIGGPIGGLDTPEENADEEMSYWDNDEG